MSQSKTRVWRAFWWSLFAVWLVLTVYLSSQNGPGSASVSGWLSIWLWKVVNNATGALFERTMAFATFHLLVRKFSHFFVHLVLAFLVTRASAWSFSWRKEGIRFAWIFAISLALFDEAVQMLAPGRVSAVFDAGLNLSGAAIGAFISSRFGPSNV